MIRLNGKGCLWDYLHCVINEEKKFGSIAGVITSSWWFKVCTVHSKFLIVWNFHYTYYFCNPKSLKNVSMPMHIYLYMLVVSNWISKSEYWNESPSYEILQRVGANCWWKYNVQEKKKQRWKHLPHKSLLKRTQGLTGYRAQQGGKWGAAVRREDVRSHSRVITKFPRSRWTWGRGTTHTLNSEKRCPLSVPESVWDSLWCSWVPRTWSGAPLSSTL